MTRITFVRGEIDRAIDVARQIGIYLNHTVEIALEPIVTAPRFIGHVLDGETLVRRKRNVRQRPGAALLDRELKDGIEFFFRDHERLAPHFVALPQRIASPARTLSRNLCLELGNDLDKMRIRKSWRNGVVKCARLVVEL